jgi:hypothetical protein
MSSAPLFQARDAANYQAFTRQAGRAFAAEFVPAQVRNLFYFRVPFHTYSLFGDSCKGIRE